MTVEEGMTWAEWCDSNYNTKGFYASTDAVRIGGDPSDSDGDGEYTGAGYYIVEDVLPNDVIISNSYTTQFVFSGGADN